MLNESKARFSNGTTVSQAKKNAKRLREERGISYTEALNQIATDVEPACTSWHQAIQRVTRRYTLPLPNAAAIDPQELPVGGGAIVLVRGASGSGKTHLCQQMVALQQIRVPEQRQYWSCVFPSADTAEQAWSRPQCTLPGLPQSTTYLTHAQLATSVFRAGDLLVVDEMGWLSHEHPSALAALKDAAAHGAIVIVLSQGSDCHSLTATAVINCSVTTVRGERSYHYTAIAAAAAAS